MSIDCHMKIDGVEGEATHKDHKNEIEVLNWSWSIQNESSTGMGGGGGKGKATPGSFMFTHTYDKASPNLAKHCASGKHFDKVVATVRKSGEGQKDFLTVTMKQVFITSVSPSAAKGGDMIESVTFDYADIEFDYKTQDAKGNLGGSVKFGWNVDTTETR